MGAGSRHERSRTSPRTVWKPGDSPSKGLPGSEERRACIPVPVGSRDLEPGCRAAAALGPGDGTSGRHLLTQRTRAGAAPQRVHGALGCQGPRTRRGKRRPPAGTRLPHAVRWGSESGGAKPGLLRKRVRPRSPAASLQSSPELSLGSAPSPILF